MEIIKQQFTPISTDKSIQVLLLTWGFGGLLEAMAGFGTAVAIPAAILISLGFKPVFSAVVSLIANSVATAFGAIGTPVLVLAKEIQPRCAEPEYQCRITAIRAHVPHPIGFAVPHRSEVEITSEEFILSTIGRRRLPDQPVHGRTLHGCRITAIIGSILSIIVIVIYGKLTAPKEERARKNPLRTKDILNAWSIYLLILLLIILTSPLFPGLRHTLENNWVTRISLPVGDSTLNYTISWLTHAGVLLFIGTFIGGLIQGAGVKEMVHRTLLR